MSTSWQRQVARLRGAWTVRATVRSGAHDYLAALLRVKRSPTGLALSERAVVDEEFGSFTESDGRRLLAYIDDAVEPGAGWWWTRVPVGGPARRDREKT